MDTPLPTLSTDLQSAPPIADDGGPAPLLPTQQAESRKAAPANSLHDSLAIALELAPQVMDNLTGRALLGMDRQATAHPDAEHRALLDSSAVAMDGQRRRWVAQFTALLRVAFAHPLTDEKALPAADLRICMGEMVELERLVLAAGSLRGNPLGPQSFVRAILELVSRSEAHPQQRQVWIHFLLGALGTQLSWVYLQLAASLRMPGSRDAAFAGDSKDFAEYADYVFGLGGKAPPPLAPARLPAVAMTPEMSALAQEASRTVKQLRAVLGLPEPDPSEQAADEVTQMMQDIEESERLMLEVGKRGLTMPEPDAPSQLPTDQIALKVENLLNEYRNATTSTLARVPSPVRHALERMQTTLTNLAKADPSLLTSADHPARQLFHAISKRSLLFANETADGFVSFFTPVQKVLEAVAYVAPPSAKAYEQALARLQPIWLQQDKELKQLQDDKERSLANLEVRKQMASRLAFELVSRRDASDTPVPIKQFLMGPWSQVLARAQLHPQYPQDQERYGYASTLLLWSVSIRRAGSQKEELVHRRPDLLHALQAGLASIDHPQSNIDAFVLELTKLHEAVLASEAPEDDSDDIFPPEPPASADLSDMMQLDDTSPSSPRSPPAAPSYQSDLNLL